VTLNTGTNDSWGGGGNPDDYFNTLEDAILKIQAKGRIAVIAKIPWPNNGGVWESKVEAFNAKIDQLYLKYPDIIKGPDLYTLSKGKTNWFSGSGDVHPNDLGASEFRKAWANSALQNIYGM
jgi:lysophospholipase L1-like esterase